MTELMNVTEQYLRRILASHLWRNLLKERNDYVNTVCLIGNLTRDPELRDAGENKVASLRIAVSGRRKQGDEWVDVPNFFDVTVWGRQAEQAAEWLEKGRQVAVTGRLQSSEYESTKFSDSDGQPARQSRVEIVATDIQYLAKPAPKEEPVEQEADAIPY